MLIVRLHLSTRLTGSTGVLIVKGGKEKFFRLVAARTEVYSMLRAIHSRKVKGVLRNVMAAY
jgi:hypothetical protein